MQVTLDSETEARLAAELEAVIAPYRDQSWEVPIAAGVGPELLPPEQRDKLNAAINEPMDSFLARFRRAARTHCCQPGGFVYEKWTKAHELSNEDYVKVTGSVLTGMGIGASNLLLLIVPVAAWLFLALSVVTLTAWCDEG